MHVEVSVALNFVISYLYNKLPRRRVDMLGIELEKGLKKKFEGHWYPDKPFKGSGFRCVRVNGEKIDPVIIQAAIDVGLDLEEMKEYLPAELTLWIDPNEVSYRIGEKGMIKILYSDRNAEENTETEDQEVQNTNRGFNPEAQIFNPDAQSFKPIDVLSASLGNLNISPGSRGLSPSSPISSASWGGSLSSSPSNTSGMFQPQAQPQPQPQQQTGNQNNKTLPYKNGGGSGQVPMFTTATFAQTKFGSTKLKSTAKRPTRLSPTEFNNFLRQKAIPTTTFQHPCVTSPTRSRSLSPRDPRVEFIIDQQQRMFQNQQQLQQQYHQQQLQLQQQQLNFQLRQHHQQQQQQFQQTHLNIPADPHQRLSAQGHHSMGSLHDMFTGPSPLQSPGHSPISPNHPSNNNNTSAPCFPANNGPVSQLGQQPVAQQSPIGSPIHSPMNSIQISPENHKALIEGLNINNVPYSASGQYHQLLLAS